MITEHMRDWLRVSRSRHERACPHVRHCAAEYRRLVYATAILADVRSLTANA